jgi:hypothetical protein
MLVGPDEAAAAHLDVARGATDAAHAGRAARMPRWRLQCSEGPDEHPGAVKRVGPPTLLKPGRGSCMLAIAGCCAPAAAHPPGYMAHRATDGPVGHCVVLPEGLPCRRRSAEQRHGRVQARQYLAANAGQAGEACAWCKSHGALCAGVAAVLPGPVTRLLYRSL